MGDQEIADASWRRAQKDYPELYQQYLLAHANELTHLIWMLQSHGSSEDRSDYALFNRLRRASGNWVERARLSERMDAVLHAIRNRIDIADAIECGAAEKVEALTSCLAVWKGRRDAASLAIDGPGLAQAAFGLSGTGDTLTLSFWCEQSRETQRAARGFSDAWHSRLREDRLGRAQVVLRYVQSSVSARF